jgi:hypothetical protein
MQSMIKMFAVISGMLMACTVPALPDDLAAIQKALDGKFALTTTTSDRTDIVTAGSVLVLKKSNLLTIDASKPLVLPNTYKNGRITQSKLIALGKAGMEGTRTFVSGEKVWLTGIEVKEKEVVFDLYTDAYNDTRYRARLNFALEKGSTPTVSGVITTVGEVFDVQQGDDQQQQGQSQPQQPQGQMPQPQRQAAPTAAVVEAPPPPIPPPPPPPADPTEIKLGETSTQVVTALGQPTKISKVGAKQIYVYKDLKVTFVNGKVSDVE